MSAKRKHFVVRIIVIRLTCCESSSCPWPEGPANRYLLRHSATQGVGFPPSVVFYLPFIRPLLYFRWSVLLLVRQIWP